MKTVLDRIHRSSIELLASVGVRFHCPEILERLAMMGVGVAGDVVRFTETQVMDCLSMAPEAFTLKARNPEKDVRIGGDSKCLAPAYGASLIVTPENRRRNATLADYLRIAKLVHATPLLTLNGGLLVQPENLSGQLSSLVMIYSAMCFSDKPLIGVQDGEIQVRRVMELGGILAGDENAFKRSPHFLFLVNTLSPLQMDAQALATLKVCAEYNQALLITPGAMFGTTSPITTVGSVIQANAEFLAAFCAAQFLSPGLPVVFGCLGAPADMRTGGLSLASPSRFTFADLAAGLAERYHLPNRGIGAVTDAGQVSVQSGYEAMFTLINDYHRRTSLSIHAAGVLASFAAFSYEQFIIDLEMIRMVNRSIDAAVFTEDDFTLDLIRETGPGGQYITKKHTLAHCRTVPYISGLFAPTAVDRQDDATRLTEGAAHALAKLENQYRCPYLPEETLKRIDAYMLARGVSAHLLAAVVKASHAV
ncbi:MAG: trimethylamine methyltransferase family protein [Desulfobacteraceae bacterium]|jgi:trimethylamine--corrinoid protein Co-methyltransferase|nr:trimethylamine methyltransferase family protein [Desulfobacteraceae bacterium]